MCRNWEAGVVAPAEFFSNDGREETAKQETDRETFVWLDSAKGREVAGTDKVGEEKWKKNVVHEGKKFKLQVPVPMMFPGPKYRAEDEPWFGDN